MSDTTRSGLSFTAGDIYSWPVTVTANKPDMTGKRMKIIITDADGVKVIETEAVVSGQVATFSLNADADLEGTTHDAGIYTGQYTIWTTAGDYIKYWPPKGFKVQISDPIV